MTAHLEQISYERYPAPWPRYGYVWQVVCRECPVGLNSGHQYRADELDVALTLADEHNRDQHHNTQRKLAAG